MKNIIMLSLFIFTSLLSFESCATNLHSSYLADLKEVRAIKGNGNNKLYSLIRSSADELQEDWSEDLAQELARVYNELLKVNQNFFLSELISPLLKKEKRFRPIFEKALSQENLKKFKKMQEMDEREEKEGNG